MTRTFATTANDTAKPLIMTFRYKDATVGSLSDTVTASTPVVAVMTDRATGATVVDRQPATVVSSTGGVVTLRYDFAPGEISTPGRFAFVFEATVNGDPLTLPSPGIVPVLVGADPG